MAVSEMDQIERLLPVEVEVTGPYHYDGDKHPCLRIAAADRIVACVYIVDDKITRLFRSTNDQRGLSIGRKGN
jgi:hypothetical protein